MGHFLTQPTCWNDAFIAWWYSWDKRPTGWWLDFSLVNNYLLRIPTCGLLGPAAIFIYMGKLLCSTTRSALSLVPSGTAGASFGAGVRVFFPLVQLIKAV